ncbi:MAG: HEAT repeat domain-containing protein, partial [bacterium]|nr:HEAT repeat domain-containing protein [bacterium]
MIGNSFFGCGNRREKIQKLIHELALWQEGDNPGYNRITNDLIRIGKQAVPDLIKTLKVENNSNRYSIIYVLSRIRDESVIPVFEELIKK